MIKVSDLKKDFPIFDREINGKRLTYLDSGATSQKPNSVINEMTNVYTNMNANVHRGTYVLSSETTAKYEEVRNKLKNLIVQYLLLKKLMLIYLIVEFFYKQKSNINYLELQKILLNLSLKNQI